MSKEAFKIGDILTDVGITPAQTLYLAVWGNCVLPYGEEKTIAIDEVFISRRGKLLLRKATSEEIEKLTTTKD